MFCTKVTQNMTINKKGEMYFQQRVKKMDGLLPCMSSIALLMLSVPKNHPTARHSNKARTRTGMFMPEKV